MAMYKIETLILLKLMLQIFEKGIYDHYMLKEINEQPAVMRRIIQEYEDEKGDLKLIMKLLKMLHLQIVYISSRQEQVIMQV